MMYGLFADEVSVILTVYDRKLGKKTYLLLEEIVNIRERVVSARLLPPESNPSSGVIKASITSYRMELQDGYFLCGIQVESGNTSKIVNLSGCAESEAWKKIVELFYRFKKRAKPDESEKEEEGVIRVGKHRAFHPEIAKILEKINDSTGAILISPGSPIDRALNKVYLSKREKPQGEG